MLRGAHMKRHTRQRWTYLMQCGLASSVHQLIWWADGEKFVQGHEEVVVTSARRCPAGAHTAQMTDRYVDDAQHQLRANRAPSLPKGPWCRERSGNARQASLFLLARSKGQVRHNPRARVLAALCVIWCRILRAHRLIPHRSPSSSRTHLLQNAPSC